MSERKDGPQLVTMTPRASAARETPVECLRAMIKDLEENPGKVSDIIIIGLERMDTNAVRIVSFDNEVTIVDCCGMTEMYKHYILGDRTRG